MKQPVSLARLPERAVFIACSSHETRCRGLIDQIGDWRPAAAVLFHYDDINPRREENHRHIEAKLRVASLEPTVLLFTEANAVKSLRDNMQRLLNVLMAVEPTAIVFDITAFTKRHLLMMLSWLDDIGHWDDLTIAYSEPEDYDVSQFIPLSFGLASFQQIPGFSACPDLSRPVHLVLFLGYEGDRALAVYEQVQPMQATLIVPDPPYKPSWRGRTEKFNADLLAVAGAGVTIRVDSIDSDATKSALAAILGNPRKRSDHARIICPLGTKPQTLGVYSYMRECSDPPAIVYASPLRHNHEFFSHGVGATWLLKKARAS